MFCCCESSIREEHAIRVTKPTVAVADCRPFAKDAVAPDEDTAAVVEDGAGRAGGRHVDDAAVDGRRQRQGSGRGHPLRLDAGQSQLPVLGVAEAEHVALIYTISWTTFKFMQIVLR